MEDSADNAEQSHVGDRSMIHTFLPSTPTTMTECDVVTAPQSSFPSTVIVESAEAVETETAAHCVPPSRSSLGVSEENAPIDQVTKI